MADIFDYVKDGGSFTGEGYDHDSKVVYSTTTAWKNRQKETPEQIQARETRIKKLQTNGNLLRDTHTPGLNTWKSIDAGNTYQTNPQKTIESLMNINVNDTIMSLDFENLGTAPHMRQEGSANYYSVTELAVVKSQLVKKNGKYRLDEQAAMSLLVKPNTDAFSAMKGLIRTLETAPKPWQVWQTGLSKDDRRTLNDLILYSDPSNFRKSADGYTELIGQNRRDQIPEGFAIGQAQVAQMKQGLFNLGLHGTSRAKARQTIIEMFKGQNSLNIGGFNTQNYDNPFFLHWLDNELIPGTKDKKERQELQRIRGLISQANDLDTRQILNVLAKDPSSRLGGLLDLTQQGIGEHLQKKGYDLDIGTAHFGLADTRTSNKVQEILMNDFGLFDMIEQGSGRTSRNVAMWDTTPLGKGNKLFSIGGLGFNQAGENDAIYTPVKNKKGKVDWKLSSSDKVAPLFTNNEYEILNEYNGIEIDGKKQYGYALKNLDTENIHVILRDSKEQIQNIMQQKMLSVDDMDNMEKIKNQKTMDKVRRSYLRAFGAEDGGGRSFMDRLMAGLEALDEGRKLGREGVQLEAFVRNYQNGNKTTKANFLDNSTGKWEKVEATESFYRDLTNMEERLRSEGKYIQDFLDALDANMPLKKDGGTYLPKAHDIALNHFKKEMDRRFGRNTTELQEAGFNVMFGMGESENQNIRVGNKKHTESDIWATLNNGTMQGRKHPAHVQKQRLLQIVNRAQAHNAISPKDAQAYRELLGSVDNSSRMSYAINELANYLNNRYKFDASITGLGKTLNTIDIEDPTKMTDARRSALEDPTQGYGKQKNDIIRRSIEHAQTIANSPWNEGQINFSNSSIIKRLDEHDNAMREIWRQAGGEGNVKRSDSKKALQGLINSFRKDGFDVALVEDARKNGLVLAVAPEEVAQRVFHLNEGSSILKSDEVMKFAIPMLDGNKDIVLPGQSRIGRPKIFATNDGEFMGTAFDEAIRNVSRLAPTARRMYKEGKVLETSKMLQGNVRRSVQQLSLNNSYMQDPNSMDTYDNRTSKASRYVRGQVIDITEYAEAWYKDTYKNKGTSSKLTKMKENYLSFFQTLDRDEMTNFHESIDAWVLENRGLVVNGHGVKDTHYANGLRSIRSVQSLQPLGYLNPTARENIPKTTNYLPLDRTETEKTLRARGFKDGEIDRMLNRRFTTDEAIRELGDEVNWVNMRAAYIDDAQLSDLMKKPVEEGVMSSKEAALFSTYEGQAVIADDKVEIMTAKRIKKIKLQQGEIIDENITKFFLEMEDKKMVTIDRDGNMKFNSDVPLEERRITKVLERAAGEDMIGSADYNKFKFDVTVGDLTKTSYMDSLHDNVFFTGLKVDETGRVTEVEFESRQLAQSSMKGGTASGQRITFKIAERKHLEAAGIDADVVLPKANPSRGLHGAFVQNKVDLYVDEAIKQIDEGKITAGTLSREGLITQELNAITGMMKNKFGIKDSDIKVEDGRIVMNHLFGRKVVEQDGVKKIISDPDMKFSLDTLEDFMTDADKRYGSKFLDSTIEYGVEGVSLADVYTWHNSVGVVADNSSGLVRLGYKEADMISQRADRILGSGNAVTGWFKSHLDNAAKAQHKNRDRFLDGINKAILDVTDEDLIDGKVKQGEIIIATQGTSFNENDREGRRIIRMNENGVPEVSAHAFEDVRPLTSSNDMLTVQDLNRTILNMGNVMGDMKVMGPAGEENPELRKLLKENGGTALFQLPTDEFSRKYVRFIDTDVAAVGVGKGAMPVMDNLQKAQMSIWRLTKQYQNDGLEETKNKLQVAVNDYEQNITKVWSSVRDGSAADMHSARLDMSGRFQIQGTNALNTEHYKEGTVYIGRERAREMIVGAEDSIAKAVGIDFSELDSNLPAEEQRAWKQNKVLDYMTSDGLYSGINRYPTIAEDAVQILKLQVDDGLGADAKGGYVTVGTAVRLKADYDGDFFSSFLTHYKSTVENTGYAASDIHKSMATIHGRDVEFLNMVGTHVRSELETTAEERGMTVQELWGNEDFRKSFHQDWGAKVGRIYDQETQRSRMGKSNVGVLDNLRYKISNIAAATYEVLGEAGYVDQEERFRKTKIAQDFGRLFSQESISSKKFSVDALRQSIAQEMGSSAPTGEALDELVSQRMSEQSKYISMLQEGIHRPDAEGRQKIVQAAQGLGIWTDNLDKKGLVAGRMDVDGGPRMIDPDSSGKWDYTPNQMLDVIQEMNQLNPEWTQSKFLKMSVSEGIGDIETASYMARGMDGSVVPTAGVEGAVPTEGIFKDTVENGKERYRRNIIRNMENMRGGAEGIESTLERSIIQEADGMLSGLTVGERAGARFANFTSNFSGALNGVGGGTGAMVGAGMFGAMWAASALMRSGPTPEGLREQTQEPQAINPLSGQSPTARVTENSGEHINIRISAKDAKNMNESQISALVHEEVAAMTAMQMNVSMNVNDNTQNIDQQWLQGVVANAINNGFGF